MIAEFLVREIGSGVANPFGNRKIQRGLLLYSGEKNRYYVYLPFSEKNNLCEVQVKDSGIERVSSQTVTEDILADMDICTKVPPYRIQSCCVKVRDIEKLSARNKSLYYEGTEIYCGWVVESNDVLLKPFYDGYVDIEPMVQEGVYWVVKQAYDYCLNPYFDKDGKLITIPEAIDYLLPIAEEEAYKDRKNTDFATVFGDKWFKKIQRVDPEEDPNLAPEKTKQYGYSPTQVYYLKCAHEYYLAHVIMWDEKKTFKALQAVRYDVPLIFDLYKRMKTEIAAMSFDEIRHFAVESVAREIFRMD